MGRNRNFSKEEKELICQKYISGQSADSLGRDYKMSGNSIVRILKQNGITIASGNKKRDHLIEPAINDFSSGILLSDILKKYNFSRSYFKKVLTKHCGTCYSPPRTILRTDDHIRLYNNIDEAKRIIDTTSRKDKLSAVGKHFNLPKSAVKSILTLHNIDITKFKSNNKITKDRLEDDNFCNMILEKYTRDRISAQKLSKEYDIGISTIKLLVQKRGYHWRCKKEATLLNNYSIDKAIYTLKCAYRSKPYTLPSGKVIKIQGYEPDFLDFVFSSEILSESDFEFDNGFRIQYSDNPIKHYYPDFYIPKFNLMIEIKSDYTLRKADPRKAEECSKVYNYICIVDKQYDEFVQVINSFNATSYKT